MIIGFYGALANNTYVSAKSFDSQGHKVIYIRDLSDSFPFSQPVWEDCELVLKYELIDSSNWSAKLWAEKEDELEWLSPAYVKSPIDIDSFGVHTELGSLFERFFRNYFFLRSAHRRSVLGAMQQADVWIVCGMEATILACASGKPYVIWPHGGDIRFAAGVGFSWRNFLGRGALSEINRWLLRHAYEKALFVGSHDPSGIGGHIGQVNYSITYFPLPMPCRYRVREKREKQKNLIDLFVPYGVTIPEGKTYIFVPSRIDYYWKGTDRLIAAIKTMKFNKLHFIFSGWGQDYSKAKQELTHTGVTFLPFAMSKAFLFKVYQYVDLVIDQFRLGSYGTSALEAMSMGTPVMMYIENKNFLDKGWLPPPVINVQCSDEIAQVLKKIDTGQFDFDSCSREISDWFDKTHNEVVAVPRIISDIHESLAAL